MKISSSKSCGLTINKRRRERGSARVPALAAVFLLLGLASGAYLHYRLATPPKLPGGQPEAERPLADSTKEVLRRLDSPVTIRFFALLDTSLPAAYKDFSGRASQVLSLYQQESGGKVKVTSHTVLSDTAETAARTDGIKAFNLDQGNPCYLGITVVCNDRKETLQLSPDWEPALEADLSRAIARVASPTPKPGTQPALQPDRAAIEEVKRVLPNLASLSVEEGSRILREQTLAAFTAASKEMEMQLKQAEERYTQATSETARQAALKDVQRIRAEQTEKLKTLTIRMQEQIATLEQLKRQ